MTKSLLFYDQIIFFLMLCILRLSRVKKKSQYLETFKGVVTNININTPNQSLSKNALREQHLYYLKFSGIKYYPNTGMLLTNAPNYAII